MRKPRIPEFFVVCFRISHCFEFQYAFILATTLLIPQRQKIEAGDSPVERANSIEVVNFFERLEREIKLF